MALENVRLKMIFDGLRRFSSHVRCHRQRKSAHSIRSPAANVVFRPLPRRLGGRTAVPHAPLTEMSRWCLRRQSARLPAVKPRSGGHGRSYQRPEQKTRNAARRSGEFGSKNGDDFIGVHQKKLDLR